ncbi:MAG: SDR family oxidoreductase [Actinobacteria bacterium]|nr:MAG: SDR family oxidoreductase [Actinomycetota bacterium]
MRKILVTGGSGFIGRNLIESLSDKYEVLAPTHSQLELTSDQAVANYFEANNIDIVIHCACKPGHRNACDPTDLVDANTRMFFNIARCADKYKKLIFVSSGAVYGMDHYQPKMKEDCFDRYVPNDEHGFSKYIISKYIENNDNIVELRVFGVFGKYEDYAIRFISNAICKALFDLPITIKQNRRFDYLYIDDLPQVIDYFIRNDGAYKVYNVTPDEAVELYALAEKVLKVSKKDLPIKVAQPGLGVEYSGENKRLRQEVRGLRFIPIDEAIKQLYAWYLDNKKLINKELLLVDK